MKSELTDFGFAFGSLEVQRVAQDGNDASIIRIKADKCVFSVRATKNGSVRFYDNLGNECELVSKDFMDMATASNK